MGDDGMNSHMINWQYFNPRFWIYRLWWALMGGPTIKLPYQEKTLVVEYGHPLWYDVGAHQVEITTHDPMWVYGPWLDQHVGKRNRDWHMIMCVDDHRVELELQFRKGKEQWANIASLMWA